MYSSQIQLCVAFCLLLLYSNYFAGKIDRFLFVLFPLGLCIHINLVNHSSTLLHAYIAYVSFDVVPCQPDEVTCITEVRNVA